MTDGTGVVDRDIKSSDIPQEYLLVTPALSALPESNAVGDLLPVVAPEI